VKQTGLRVLTSPAGFRGKGNTWVSIPHPTAKDSQASRSVLSRRSGSLAWLATQLGAAERATLKFVCDNKLDISSLPCAKVVLTPAQCIDIQATLRLSNSGVRTLAKVLKDCGVNAIFASAAKMKSLSDDWIIEACYYSGVMLDASKGGETISTLVYTANVFDMIARDLDILFSKRLFHQWEFDCFKEFTSTNSYDILSWFTKTSSESYNSLSYEQIHSRISELSLFFNFNYFIVMIQE
jgi:hypothetical protein